MASHLIGFGPLLLAGSAGLWWAKLLLTASLSLAVARRCGVRGVRFVDHSTTPHVGSKRPGVGYGAERRRALHPNAVMDRMGFDLRRGAGGAGLLCDRPDMANGAQGQN